LKIIRPADEDGQAIQSNYEIAEIHMRGLVKMLELRGGLAGFNHCQVLQRVIAWFVARKVRVGECGGNPF
jgi:hypothetical protein